MANALEWEILALAGVSVDGLRRAIKLCHDQGNQIAVPYEPLLTAVQRVLDRNGDIYTAFAETVRAHQYAFSLEDKDKLIASWQFFIARINKC
jgi:hypothetical protein